MNCIHGTLAKIGAFWFCVTCDQQFTISPVVSKSQAKRIAVMKGEQAMWNCRPCQQIWGGERTCRCGLSGEELTAKKEDDQ